jgi:hypothetical protein
MLPKDHIPSIDLEKLLCLLLLLARLLLRLSGFRYLAGEQWMPDRAGLPTLLDPAVNLNRWHCY